MATGLRRADLARWACLLLPFIVASCRGGAGSGPVERRQADLDFSTGDVKGTILWNGAPISEQHLEGGFVASDANGTGFYIYSSTYSAVNLVPGDHTLTLYGGAYCFESPNELGESHFTITAASPTTADVDLTATAGQLRGAVAINGVPLSDAWIVIDTQPPCMIGSSFTYQYGLDLRGFVTDGDGAFSRLLAPADYSASVYGPSGRIGSVSFRIVPGQTTDVGTLDIPAGDLQWTISWGGASVGLQESYSLLAAESGGLGFWVYDATGTAAVVSTGAHTLGLFANSCRDATNKLGEAIVIVTAGATAATTLDLSSTAGRVAGSITINGVPLSSARIAIDPQCSTPDLLYSDVDGTVYTSVYRAESDGDLAPGFFTGQDGDFARLLAPGSYTAHVSRSSGRLHSFVFNVLAGQTTNVGNIDVPMGGVQGTVLWNGVPIGTLESSAPRLHVAEPGGLNALFEGSTYSVATLSPGVHTLGLYTGVCTGPAERIAEATFTVDTGATATADFELRDTAGRITGSITANGLPLRTFINLDNTCISFMGDETGRFARFLPSGTYSATIFGTTSQSGGRFGSFSFGILAGQTTDVDSVTTPAGTDVLTDLSGGIDSVNGLSLEFAEVTTAGNTTVVESGVCPSPCNPPPTGFEVVGARYWDISTTAIFSGPIHVCIHYDPAEVRGNESALLLEHDDGSGYANIRTSIDTVRHVVCGFANSLSPFIVVQPKFGRACTSSADCGSSSCVDGVCCASACGGGDTTDCQACSVAAGGTTDGTCTPVSAARVCRPSAGICDAAETCDGSSLQCPANALASPGTTCRASAGACHIAEACMGTSAACPADTLTPVGTTCRASVGACDVAEACTGVSQACPADSVVAAGTTCRASAGACDVAEACTGASAACPSDKLAPAGQACRTSAGACDIVETCSGSAAACPANSFVAAGTICQPATNACQSPGTCSGSGAICPAVTPIPGCGTDRTPPVFTNVPGTITSFATSTSGAKVTYTKPTATDAVDGDRPVTCVPAPGTTFAPGKTTVTCTATDKSNNTKTATFTAWVQYQAPTDGTFFLAPIRANGSSILRIGRPVPVRFKLTGASAGITNLVAKLIVTKVSSAVQGTIVDTSDETDDDTDFIFKFRAGLKLYAYRWRTTNQTQGTYQLKADLGDGVVHQINVSLRAAK